MRDNVIYTLRKLGISREQVIANAAVASMSDIAHAARNVKKQSTGVGPSCIDFTKIHPILPQTGDKESHSIGSICPSCGISLYSHGEAVKQ